MEFSICIERSSRSTSVSTTAGNSPAGRATETRHFPTSRPHVDRDDLHVQSRRSGRSRQGRDLIRPRSPFCRLTGPDYDPLDEQHYEDSCAVSVGVPLARVSPALLDHRARPSSRCCSTTSPRSARATAAGATNRAGVARSLRPLENRQPWRIHRRRWCRPGEIGLATPAAGTAGREPTADITKRLARDA